MHTNRPSVRPASVPNALLVLSLIATLATFAGPTRAVAAADPKTVAKCQAALAKSGAKFVGKKIGTLAKCTDGIFKCIQTVDETADAGAKRTACIAKARAKCAGALGAITAARQAFVAGATKACAGLDAAQVTGNDGLGFTGVDCAAFGGAVTDLASLTACLAKQHDCLASQIFQLQVPRVLELLQFTPPDAVTVAPGDADALACLDPTGGTGADVNDVALGKSVAKCQKAIAKSGGKLASQRLAGLSKCANALFTCAATKSGDDLTKCNAKAKAGCAKAFAKNDDQSDALEAAAGKACGDPTVFPAFLSPAGGNLEALLPNTLTTGPRTRALSGICSPLVTVADYQLCLVVHLLGLADELVTFAAPRTESLLSSVGCSVDKCEGGGPPPPDVPGIYQILNAAGDGTHAFDTSRAVAVDDDGNVYAPAQGTNNVFKITPSGTITQILDASGDGQGHTCESPRAIAVGPNNTVYAGSREYVFKITAGGTITTILGPDGAGGPFDGFRSASSILVTPDETVYVTGALSDTAHKITKAGVITKLIDENGDGLGQELLDPEGIAVDSQGNVYVTDIQDGGIFKITSAGAISYIDTLGFPTKIIARGDDLYFSNLFRVVKRAANGTTSTVIDATGDGQGHLLDTPVGIAFDSVGNLYVAGVQSNNVFKVTPGGTKTQIIGPDGDGTGNLLDGPEDVAVDAQGRVITGGFTSDNVFRIILP